MDEERLQMRDEIYILILEHTVPLALASCAVTPLCSNVTVCNTKCCVVQLEVVKELLHAITNLLTYKSSID